MGSTPCISATFYCSTHDFYSSMYCEFCTKNQHYQLIKWKLQHHFFFLRDAKQIIWTIEYFLALFWIKMCCQRVWIRIFWHPLRAILACLGIILNSITYPSLPRILWLPKLLLSNIIFNYNCFKYPPGLSIIITNIEKLGALIFKYYYIEELKYIL